MKSTTLLLVFLSLSTPLLASPGNRLVYLDGKSPFYVNEGVHREKTFPRLTTPMWFGEDDVDAVIILSIDDLRTQSVERYRDFLAPILARLKEIEGHSPFNIFATTLDPAHPQLEAWVAEGVLCDTHTRTHPCPLLQRGSGGAVSEVLDCLEILNRIPGHRSVAFRMPCCDSINSASPLFFSEIFPERTADGGFLEVDTSVAMFPAESYREYAPFKNYATTAANYPYPWVIARQVWEFPIIVPTDWQAQNIRGKNSPGSVADVKAAVDRVVEAQGLYTWCFHPHGWIRNDQIVEVIDHVVAKYGRRVRFLNIQDALERINRNLLGGVPLRAPDGADNGVRLLDLDNDGHLDGVIGNDATRRTRLWNPRGGHWRVTDFPFQVVTRDGAGKTLETGVRFGVLRKSGHASALVLNETRRALAHFDGRGWNLADPAALEGLRVGGEKILAASAGRDRGVRLRDIDGDGLSDLLVNNESQNAAFRWDPAAETFRPHARTLPAAGGIADAAGKDGGLRFWDLDGDGHDDVVLSNDREYYVYLFEKSSGGWTRRVLHGPAGSGGALPRFVSGGRDRGAWFRDGVLYVANEDTVGRPDLVEVRRFDRLLEHKSDPPKEPGEALKCFRLPPGFRIEKVAAEPLVTDPVSVEFGADGRIWVAEMGSYPLGQGPDAGGRVRILRDRDGDGRVDESVVFARGLSFPSGALPFRKGVLVTCAPEILYLEDTDGDGHADLRRPVFTGFGEGNHQHRVNGLHHGMDNWIYGANGDSGGDIRFAADPARPPVPMGRRDFRFTPDLAIFEPVTGRTQFGLAFDDFGNRLGCSNSRHILHAVLPDRYLRRNPHHAPPDPVLDIPDHGAMARIFQISRQLLSVNAIHRPGHFSSACGISVYRGDRFPAGYRGSTFVCEPVGNVVHRDVLVPAGATFRATRAPEEKESEFLASTDTWFRPVFTATGPDGALWVVDMYRPVIEHPQYIPPEIQQILDMTGGRDRGRIYRILHEGSGDGDESWPTFPDLTGESDARLVELLAHGNGWWRDTAQRLLVTRRATGVAAALKDLARPGTGAATRVHALWTLEGLARLDDATLMTALEDPDARVREHAIRLAESRLGESDALRARALSRVGDDAFRVRLQAAFTVGESDGDEAAAALARLARRDGEDRWMREAILSSSVRHAGALLAELFGPAAGASGNSRTRGLLDPLVRTLVRRGDLDEVGTLLAGLAAGEGVERWHIQLVGALGARRGAGDGGVVAALERDGRKELARRAAAALERIRARALSTAGDRTTPLEQRVEAVAVLGPPMAADGGVAARFLSPDQPPELQLAAVRALTRVVVRGDRETDARVAAVLLAAWPHSGPGIRGEILEALLSRPARARELLRGLDDGSILASELDDASRKRLLESDDEGVKRRAAGLLNREAPRQREEILARYREEVARIPGDPIRGRDLFAEHCATCHRLEGVGHAVGPDLAETRSKEPALLVEAILNPGGMVPPRYTPYTVHLRTGSVATGLIASETATAITLSRAEGVTETILRQDIARLVATPGTLMPAELEKAMTPEQMAHLLGFLAMKPAELGRVEPEAAAAARARVRASGHNGLTTVLRAANTTALESWVGRVRMHFLRQRDGLQEVVWKTDPVPASLAPEDRHAFRLPAAMGCRSHPAGHFTLYLGEQKLLDFDVTIESQGWQSADGSVTLSYHVRARNAEDSTGLLVLEVPGSLLTPGQSATLRVVGSAADSRRWFGILPLR